MSFAHSFAVTAQTVKISDVPFDLSVEAGSGHIHDVIEAVHFQINDPSALRADKMIMSRSICVKMIHTISKPQTLYLTDVRKKRKVAVYSAKTDIRIFSSDIHIHRIGSRMVFTSHKKVFDHLSLSAVFEGHFNSLKIGIITIMVNITNLEETVNS